MNYSISKIIYIQKWFRGYIFRKKRLPLVLYKIQKYLRDSNIIFFQNNNDGRINSCFDEINIIEMLLKKFKIQVPHKRMWYDMLVFDNYFGWIPVNIKTTTTKTNDNVGNFALCVYSYTDEELDLSKSYSNGEMSALLYEKLSTPKPKVFGTPMF